MGEWAGVRGLLRTPLPWLAALLAAYLLVPIAAYFPRLASAPREAFSTPGLASALLVSLVTATVSTIIIALLGVPLAYLLSRGRGRSSLLVGIIVQLPLALPPLISGVLLIYLVGPYSFLGTLFGGRLTGTMVGIVIAQTFVAAPFLIVAARSAFSALDPALDDVAATLGHGPFSRFMRVALPAAAPGIGAGLLLSWLRAFGEFGATVLLAYHPYSLPVFLFVQFGSDGLIATLLPAGAALVTAFLVLLGGHLVTKRWRRGRTLSTLPLPRPPSGTRTGEAPSFDFDATIGEFHLRLTHRGTEPRLAILGPSGAGKSFTLRLLSGLARGRMTSVQLGARDLTELRVEQRGLGYVPQDAALFPHLTVWKQVTFGVESDPGVAVYWLGRLGVAELAHRLPHQLSGGQRRRVALARALSTNPRLLLLDEPFTGLDTPVRDQLRRELRALQRETGLPTVLVTHDATEAALLADEVLVIDDGRLLQAGTQPDVFAHPTGPTVARLLGSLNLVRGEIVDANTVSSGAVKISVTAHNLPVGCPVQWAIEPEQIQVSSEGQYHAVVTDKVSIGSRAELLLTLRGGVELLVRSSVASALDPGDDCRVAIPPEAITLWREAPPGADPRGSATDLRR